MHQKIFAIFIFSTLLYNHAEAESLTSQTIDSCTALAKVIGRSYEDKLSNRERDALKYDIVCNYQKSGSDTGLQISANGFNLGGNFSNRDTSDICSNNYKNTHFSDFEAQQARTIFEPALRTIDNCLAASQHGWKINYKVNNDSIFLTLENNNQNGGIIYQIRSVPETALKCSPILPSERTTLRGTYSTVCERDVKNQVVDEAIRKEAPDANLYISLSEGTFLDLPIPGYTTSIMSDMSKRVADLESKLASLKNSMASWGNSVDGPMIAGRPNTATTSACPDGSYVAGVKMQGSGTGYCNGCLNGLQVLCRKIKTD